LLGGGIHGGTNRQTAQPNRCKPDYKITAHTRQFTSLFAKRNSSVAGLLILHGDNGKGKPEADLVINPDFNVVKPVFRELDAAENMNIGRVRIQGRKAEPDGGFGDRSIVITTHHQRFLLKFPGATTPSGPQTKFEKSNGHNWGGDHIDDSHQRLAAIDFLTHILTKDCGLQVWKDVRCHHND